MIVFYVLIMFLITEVILVFIMEYQENERKMEMKGKVRIAIDDYNELIDAKLKLDEIYTILADKTAEEIKSNAEKAKRTEYIADFLFVDAKDICNATGWDFYRVFKEEFDISSKKRAAIIESRLVTNEVVIDGLESE